MVFVKIIIFFGLLFFFFVISGVWHWVWFGGGAERLGGPLARAVFFRKKDEQAARAGGERLVRIMTVVLVLADIAGMYGIIYLLLTS